MDHDVPALSRGPEAIRLRFSSHEDFLAELRERGPNLEPIVRLTFRRAPDESGAPFVHVTLLATYLRRVDATGPAPLVAVVQLAEYLGSVWPGLPDEGSRACRERADELRAAVGGAAEELGYAVAAGVYCAASGPGAG